MSEEKKVIELNDEDLKSVSGGVKPVGDIAKLVVGNFYTITGNTTQLFRVAYVNLSAGTVICGIYNYDFVEDRATNTKGSTTNYGPNDLKPHATPLEIVL